GNFNLTERGFRAQQVLQGFLFIRQGVLPFLLLQFFRGRLHGSGGGIHVFHKTAELLVLLGQLAALHASRERPGLIAQLGLHPGKKFGRVGGFLLRGFLVALMLPCFSDDFLFALRNVVGVLLAATSAATAHLLGLREFAFKWLGLNEGDVRARFRARVLRGGVEADHIAGNKFGILQRNG